MARIGLGALIAFEYSAIPLYLHSSTPLEPARSLFLASKLAFSSQMYTYIIRFSSRPLVLSSDSSHISSHLDLSHLNPTQVLLPIIKNRLVFMRSFHDCIRCIEIW
jgi:hypothetical protein